MAFSTKIKNQILVHSARHCCVCHASTGLNIEIHHIIPQDQGGKDNLDNAIALCFNCHSDAGHYFAGHPKGAKLSPSELRKHKKSWMDLVSKNKIEMPAEMQIELIETNHDKVFKPEFIENKIKYLDREKFKKTLKMLKIDFKPIKTGNRYLDCEQNKIKTLDDYIDFLNGGFIKKMKENNSEKELDIQPKTYLPSFSLREGFTVRKKSNLSVCTLNLRLINNGPDLLEDFKIYLEFENIIKAESINKRKDYSDLYRYQYNVFFANDFKAEFIPKVKILVQNDSIDLDPICFLTSHQVTDVVINWKIVARNFNMTDQIRLQIIPKIECSEYDRYVDDPENYKPITEIKFKYK